MTLVRYIAIQLLAYAVDMGAFLALIQADMIPPVAANVVAKVAAGCFAFVAHRFFTFRAADDGNSLSQGARYFALLAANIPLASLALWGLMSIIETVAVAKFVADVVCVLLTYTISKRFVFIRGAVVPVRARDAVENRT